MTEPHNVRDFDGQAVQVLTEHRPFTARPVHAPGLGPVVGFGTPLLLRRGGALHLRPDLDKVFAGVHRFALRERRALEGLARHLSRGPASAAPPADWAVPLSELAVTARQARQLALRGAEPLLAERLPADILRRYERSRELVALYGLAVGAPQVLSRELLTVLRDTAPEARQRCWWLIGFAALPERAVSLTARATQQLRLRAATGFGLFDGESQLNLQEREAGSADMTGPSTREEAERVRIFLAAKLDEVAAVLRASAFSAGQMEAVLDPLRLLAGQARLGLSAPPVQIRRAPASLRERALGPVTLSGQRPRQIQG